MNFYSSLLYFYSPRNLEEELEEVESRKRSKLVILSLSLSLSLALSFDRAHDKGACREISRCKWVVTDPPQCRTNLKDHFPARPYFTSERCETRRGERELVVMNRGTTHTPRNGRCMCILRLQFRIGLVLIHSRAELRSPSTIPPRVSRLISPSPPNRG